MDNCWNRYCVSFGSFLTTRIRFPCSWMNSMIVGPTHLQFQWQRERKCLCRLFWHSWRSSKQLHGWPMPPPDSMYHRCANERTCRRLWHPTPSYRLAAGTRMRLTWFSPSRVPTDIRIISSVSLNPTAMIGRAWSQTPECSAQAESRRAWSRGDSAFDNRLAWTTKAIFLSHAFCTARDC